MERQAHDFKRQQQIGKDDCRIHAENLGRFNRDLGREGRFLADLQQRMLLANGAILGHVPSAWRINQTGVRSVG